jgi:hypothetical protein
MFNDNQDNQDQSNTDMDKVAQDISGATPIGLGMNPSTFNPVMPAQSDSATSAPTVTNDQPVGQPVMPSPDFSAPATPSTPLPEDLDDIKNQALQQLSPLVDKLEQSPEDHFKTIMMLIQASDNHELVREAYSAANAITDEQLKAEALLAVVNEINYFTQKHADQQQ